MISISETEDYRPLIDFFIENELEFEEGEEYGDDEIIKCWRADKIDDNHTTLIGACVLAKREGEYICDGIAVSPGTRNSGLGARLLELLKRTASERGASRIFLVARAPAFFAKEGFATVPRDDAPGFVECFTCPQYGKTCHPEVMRIDLPPPH
jgi:N-acetylglutamate synthase-like GNAT family acetyltransferase